MYHCHLTARKFWFDPLVGRYDCFIDLQLQYSIRTVSTVRKTTSRVEVIIKEKVECAFITISLATVKRIGRIDDVVDSPNHANKLEMHNYPRM